MSDRLTAAGAALVNDPEAGHEETCDTWRQRGCDCGLRYTVAAIENEAAARAVDEALSVEVLPEDWTVDVCIVYTAADVNGDEHRAAHKWHATAMHGEGHEMGAVDASGPTLTVALSNLAAALVAHLTKKEETHD